MDAATYYEAFGTCEASTQAGETTTFHRKSLHWIAKKKVTENFKPDEDGTFYQPGKATQTAKVETRRAFSQTNAKDLNNPNLKRIVIRRYARRERKRPAPPQYTPTPIEVLKKREQQLETELKELDRISNTGPCWTNSPPERKKL